MLDDWFTSQGVYLDSRLEVVTDQGAHSVRANQPIPQGSVVATIPKSAVLSPRTASCSLRVDLLPRDLPPCLLLSVCLLHEVLIGARSRWAPYLGSLPRSTVAVAALWDRDSSAYRWAQGTELEIVLRELGINKEHLSSFYSTTVLPFLSTPSSPPPPCSLSPTLDLFLWSYSIVSSRAFQIDTYHSLSLVPLADLFDHSDEHDVVFESDTSVCATCGSFDECTHDAGAKASRERKADDYICDLVTNSDVAAGQKVFNTYGPLSNARLLACYGFALEANAFEMCSFSFEEVVLLSPLDITLENWSSTLRHWQLKNLALPAESTSLLVADATGGLFFDAEAKTSVGLWLLLALGHLPDLPKDVERRCQTLLRIQAEGSPGDEEETRERRCSVETDAFGVVARAVVALARHRLQAGHEPLLRGAVVLGLAEKEEDGPTRTAMEFAAGERLLLECVVEGWA